MGNPEEREYQAYDGTCKECGNHVIYFNSIKKHPDNILCRDCEKVKNVKT